MCVYEIYVEKKSDFAEEAASVLSDLRLVLQAENIKTLRILNRYFIEGITDADFHFAKDIIFFEPPVDIVYDNLPSFESDCSVFAVEFLPGQFDQRADSCAQCISLITGKERPIVKSAKIYVFTGDIQDAELAKIKSWLINPVESREASLEKPVTLMQKYPEPQDVSSINNFINFSEDELKEFILKMNLAMDLNDLKFCQAYFQEEKRDPAVTEIRVLDTYWSDHCRHTTFLTELEEIEFEEEEVHAEAQRHGDKKDVHTEAQRHNDIKESFNRYMELRKSLGCNNKPITLMDIATIGVKVLKQRGLLSDLDESDEINACSVKIKADVNGKDEDWLLMFKNETHNHPTEIEPFGGAATCLGGAIRDPLSGRAFVYQAMRITGAADPRNYNVPPRSGKLPQFKICRTAAAGFSSYGNQIGLATGHVHEIYHPGYEAKRMEIGAVIGAVPVHNVVRKAPIPGDLVILVGGRTGRDGIGGATGSSKAHNASSLETCTADVQKGNAPEERKLQRLFRNPEASRLIKKCNDFGAGGVCVSAGELADGLTINLDKVPKKYEGLDGTELAISESQERMSVVTSKEDADKFIALAGEENLEATVIAEVTKEKRLVMKWRGKKIVDLNREFLNSNGAKRSAKVIVKQRTPVNIKNQESHCAAVPPRDFLFKHISDLKYCSQKGLIDRFDSSVGSSTVSSPFGGKYMLTPSQTMTAKIPVLQGDTRTCSIMSWGFDPDISNENPYRGAVFAVVYSVAKIIASGGSRKKCRLSFQEYFERLRDDPVRWGKPFAALLGALDAQMGLEVAAIGGKDSMSGSFEDLDVPPTLVSFAVSASDIDNIITPEFKKAGSFVYLIKIDFKNTEDSKTEDYFECLRFLFDETEELIKTGKILSCWAAGPGGTAEAIPKMCFGNRFGFNAEVELSEGHEFCGFVIETEEELTQRSNYEFLGRTKESYTLKTPSFESFFFKIQAAWERTLESVYPYLNNREQYKPVKEILFNNNLSSFGRRCRRVNKNSKPVFLIPVFPGTNSEYDTARAVEKAGGKAKMFVIRNLTSNDIANSVSGFVKELKGAQGLIIPGGFSGGDEPDGSGKFITSFIRNYAAGDAVMELLQKRDGLICGICNGFQALIKLGLVPYGEIRNMKEDSPTLTYNSIGRHQSVLARTRIVSNSSPWLSHFKTGDTYIVPVSHGEGRFIADENLVKELAAAGQIATIYADTEGNPSQEIRYNPNNSIYAIEGITSPCGRVFGRMAHNERVEEGCYLNIPKIKKMDIFSGAVAWFS